MSAGARLSVVLPTCGRPVVLRRVLERVRSELRDPLDEVVVVHDGEAPDPELRSLHPGLVQLETGARRGPSAARNLGGTRARGDVVVFLDDDVEPAPGALAAIRQELAAGPPAAVVARIEPAPGVRRNHYVRFAYSGIAHGGAPPGPVSFAHFCTSFAALDRELFLRAGGFDTSFDRPGYEDVELGYRLARDGVPLRLSASALGLHHRQMDRSWFVARCERGGALLRKIHGLHPGLVPLLPGGTGPGAGALCLGGRTAWRAWKRLLPLAEALPWPAARSCLRAVHLAGTAMSYRGIIGPC